MRSRKANPLKLLPSIESEAEPAKLPLFEGKQLFVVYPFGFWGNASRHWAFTEKLNGNALIFLRKEGLEGFGEVSNGKEREKKLKKALALQRKGCLEVCLAGKNIYISMSLEYYDA